MAYFGALGLASGRACGELLDALEQDWQRPVMSANQASLWHCLRLSGVNTPVNGYGRLLLI
jgi:maleate isomerase